MKKLLFFSIGFPLIATLAFSAATAQEKRCDVQILKKHRDFDKDVLKLLEERAELVKNLDPYMCQGKEPDPNEPDYAMKLVKRNYYNWNWQYATDQEGMRANVWKGIICDHILARINKRGQKRVSAAFRGGKHLFGKEDGVDVKSFLIYLTPEDIRGFRTLTITYIDKTKPELNWIWLPSLRKIRRLGAAQGEDFIAGDDCTYDDVITTVPSDHDWKLDGTEVIDEEFLKKHHFFPGDLIFAEQDRCAAYMNPLKGTECWVVSGAQNQGYQGYHTKRMWIDKNYNDIYHEVYDEKGRMSRYWVCSYQAPFGEENVPYENMRWVEYWWDIRNVLTQHRTEVSAGPIRFDIGIADTKVSQRAFLRSK